MEGVCRWEAETHRKDRDRTINSIVLLANGISFAIQIVLFLIIGSLAGSLTDIVDASTTFDARQITVRFGPGS